MLLTEKKNKNKNISVKSIDSINNRWMYIKVYYIIEKIINTINNYEFLYIT